MQGEDSPTSQPRPDIDLNKPYLVEEEAQPKEHMISQDGEHSQGQTYSPFKLSRPYIYTPRKPEEEYSQTKAAKRKRRSLEKLREKGGRALQESLAKKKVENSRRERALNEQTKQTGVSARTQNVKSRIVTAKVRQGIASKEDLAFFEERKKRARKSELARVARLREARLAVQQGNPTPAHLAELEKRQRKVDRFKENSKKKTAARRLKFDQP